MQLNVHVTFEVKKDIKSEKDTKGLQKLERILLDTL